MSWRRGRASRLGLRRWRVFGPHGPCDEHSRLALGRCGGLGVGTRTRGDSLWVSCRCGRPSCAPDAGRMQPPGLCCIAVGARPVPLATAPSCATRAPRFIAATPRFLRQLFANNTLPPFPNGLDASGAQREFLESFRCGRPSCAPDAERTQPPGLCCIAVGARPWALGNRPITRRTRTTLHRRRTSVSKAAVRK